MEPHGFGGAAGWAQAPQQAQQQFEQQAQQQQLYQHQLMQMHMMQPQPYPPQVPPHAGAPPQWPAPPQQQAMFMAPPVMQPMVAAPPRLPQQPQPPLYHSQPHSAHTMSFISPSNPMQPLSMGPPFADTPARNGRSGADGGAPARTAPAGVLPGPGLADGPPSSKRPAERAGSRARVSDGASESKLSDGVSESKPRRGAPPAKRRKATDEEEEGYAYDWRPPPRRERGSRALGDVVEPEPFSAYTLFRNGGTPTPPRTDAPPAPLSAAAVAAARAKAQLDAIADAEARAAAAPLKIAARPEGVDWDENRLAMLKMLTELFQPRHLPFTRPFLSPTEAGAFSPPVLTLLPLRDLVVAGDVADPSEFSWRLRHVVAVCYLGHGNPLHGSPVAKKAEKLDALFEQQVLMLPRRVRARACLVNAESIVNGVPPRDETGGDGRAGSLEDDGCDGEGRRRSSRARIETQALSTIQIVEAEKSRQRSVAESEKRAERDRQRVEAEAWARSAFAPEALAPIRTSPDAVSACHFLSAYGEYLGAGPFSLPETEIALGCVPRTSSGLRRTFAALLRAARLPLPSGASGERASSIELALAVALCRWEQACVRARELDESGLGVPEALEPYLEGEDMSDVVAGLGDARELAAVLRRKGGEAGLDGATPLQRAGLAHALCHAALLENRSLVAHAAAADNASPAALAAGRATVLGTDGDETTYFYFEHLEARVYALKGEGIHGWTEAELAAAVTPGELIEVEVEEGGAIEWRKALVSRILRGGRGRFAAIVFLKDGKTLDEEFVEIFSLHQCGKEWRKRQKGAPKGKKQAKPAKQAKAAAPSPASSRRQPARGGGAPPANEDETAGEAAAEAAAAEAEAEAAAAAAAKAVAAAGASEGAPAAAAPPSFFLVDVEALLARLRPPASAGHGKPKKQPKGRGAAKNSAKASDVDRLRREAALYRALEPIPAAQAEAAAAAGRAWSAAAVRLKKDAEAPADDGPPSISGSAREAAAEEKRVVAWLARGAAVPVDGGEGDGGLRGRIGGWICEAAAFGCA